MSDYGESFDQPGAGEIIVGAAIAFAVVCAVFVATWRYQPYVLRRDIDRLEQRIEQLEKQEPTDAH